MAVAALGIERRTKSLAGYIWRWFDGDWLFLGSVIALLAIAILGLIAPHLPLPDPELPVPEDRLQSPSWSHPFGTDVNGSDILSRVLHAPRVDLVIAILSVLLALALGSVIGLFGTFFQGRGGIAGLLTELLNRTMDILQSFPAFIVALALAGVVGSDLWSVIGVLTFLFTPIFFRFMRAEVLHIRERLFIEAQIAAGSPLWRVLFVNVSRNSVGAAVVQASPTMGFAILLTAGLAFLGVGVKPPTPEWGLMISSGQEQLYVGRWWPAIFPGMAIAITVFSLAVIGEALRRRLEQ